MGKEKASKEVKAAFVKLSKAEKGKTVAAQNERDEAVKELRGLLPDHQHLSEKSFVAKVAEICAE